MRPENVLLSRLATTYGYDTYSAGVMFRRMTDTGGWDRYFVTNGLIRAATFGPSHYNYKSVRGDRQQWVPVRGPDGKLIPNDGVIVVEGLVEPQDEVSGALRVVTPYVEPDPDCLSDLTMLHKVGSHFGRPRVPTSHVGLLLTCWGGVWGDVYQLDDGASGGVFFGSKLRPGFPLHVVPDLAGVHHDARTALTKIHAHYEHAA